LLTEVELAVLAGRNLDQIEAEIIDSSGLDEDSQSAAWLYAWSYDRHASWTEFALPPG
jgi:hypothetical protein